MGPTISKQLSAQIIGPVVNTVYFSRDGKGLDLHFILDVLSARSGNIAKVMEHLWVLDCEKKKRALQEQKLTMRSSHKTLRFLIIAL